MNNAPYLDSRQALRVIHGPDNQNRDFLLWAVLIVGSLLLGFIFKNVGPSIDRETVQHVLGWPLESTFTLSTIFAGVLCFRTWERMYPTTIPAAYTLFPLRSSAVLMRQVIELCFDAIAVAMCLTAWMLPSWILTESSYADYALLYAWIASIVIAGIAFGVPAIVVRGAFRSADRPHTLQDSMVVQAAPAAAFGVAVFFLLLLKLGVEEIALSVSKASWMSALWAKTSAQQGNPLLTPSAILAIGGPLGCAALAFLIGVINRLRYWLHDAIRVSAAAAYEPDLSYSWIEARVDKENEPNAAVALAKRDIVRIRRSEPFRIWIALGLTLVTSLIVYLAAPSTRWIALVLFYAWMIAWLRLPDRMMEMWPQSLWEWDALMAEKGAIHRARWITMTRILLPYMGFLLLPGIVYGLCYRPWWPAGIAVLAIAILITQAYIRLHKATS